MSETIDATKPSTPTSVRQRLKAERVQVMLQGMPAWRLVSGGKALDRAFLFPTPRVASAYTDFVSAYATETGQAVSLEVVKDQVVVTLFGPRVKGRHAEVNETVLEFAQKLG
jgi:pterin-4a-carbinolamine dehydratase